jgi:hypothetical protein
VPEIRQYIRDPGGVIDQDFRGMRWPRANPVVACAQVLSICAIRHSLD